MFDWQRMKAERWVQPVFMLLELALAVLLVAVVSNFYGWLRDMPDRTELGPRRSEVRFTPVDLGSSAGPLRVAGAWRVTGDDPRFGGISALAIDHGRLLAMSDSGVVIRFAPPGALKTIADIDEVPLGPNPKLGGRYKTQRDSEALARDSDGRGWWVSYETRNQLWLYDDQFGRALQRLRLGGSRWKENVGVEGLARGPGGDLLLFPERERSVYRLRGRLAWKRPLGGLRGRISEASSDGRGGLLLIESHMTLTGYSSALAEVEPVRGGGYRIARRISLPLGPIDFPEALAVERRPDGSRRLWLMTDNNFQRPFRTLLVALDWPAGA
jgi:hypothetical protein